MKTLIFLLLMNGTTAMDWSQTRYAARHPAQFRELNPIIGSHPSLGKIDTYFVGVMAIQNVVFFALPDKYRFYWAGANIAIETAVVLHNNSIGVQMRF